MHAKNINKSDELRYYNVKKHEIVIIILMVVVFVGIILVMPWLIAGIDLLFRQIPGWGDLGADTTATFNIGVLPDFLGGAVGIIAGFIMEWCFFDQLKLLGKYKTLVALLLSEFSGIYEEFLWQNRMGVSTVREFIADDIILNADHSIVIYNIHRFPWSKKGNIYKLVFNIYGHIEKFNVIVGKLVKLKKDDIKRKEAELKANSLQNKIKEEIESFFRVAGEELKAKSLQNKVQEEIKSLDINNSTRDKS